MLVGAVGTLWGYLGGEGGGYLAGAWMPMDGSAWGAMAILAAAIIVGSVGAAIAYQLGRPSVIASYDFAYVGFAAIWGAMLFGETPDAQAVAGIALIVCAGLLAVRRRA